MLSYKNINHSHPVRQKMRQLRKIWFPWTLLINSYKKAFVYPFSATLTTMMSVVLALTQNRVSDFVLDKCGQCFMGLSVQFPFVFSYMVTTYYPENKIGCWSGCRSCKTEKLWWL